MEAELNPPPDEDTQAIIRAAQLIVDRESHGAIEPRGRILDGVSRIGRIALEGFALMAGELSGLWVIPPYRRKVSAD